MQGRIHMSPGMIGDQELLCGKSFTWWDVARCAEGMGDKIVDDHTRMGCMGLESVEEACETDQRLS